MAAKNSLASDFITSATRGLPVACAPRVTRGSFGSLPQPTNSNAINNDNATATDRTQRASGPEADREVVWMFMFAPWLSVGSGALCSIRQQRAHAWPADRRPRRAVAGSAAHPDA